MEGSIEPTQSPTQNRSALTRSRAQAARTRAVSGPPLKIMNRESSSDSDSSDNSEGIDNTVNPLGQTPELSSSLQVDKKSDLSDKTKSTETEKDTNGDETDKKPDKKKDFSIDHKAIIGQIQNAQGIKQKLQAARTELKRQAASKVKDQVRKEVKKVFKEGVKKSATWLINTIAGSIDGSTAGISTLVDGLVYIVTFGWMNLEMIYGSYIAGGKSTFIAPLTVDPLPVPMDKKSANLLLHLFVIAADIFIVMVLLPVVLLAGTIVYIIAMILTNPNELIGLVNEIGLTGLYDIVSSILTI